MKDLKYAKLVNRDGLATHVEYADYTIRSFADAVTFQLMRNQRRGSGALKSCSKSTVHGLLSGARATTSLDVAKAMEQVLKVPPMTFFAPTAVPKHCRRIDAAA
ncbi:hypothetical protein ACLQ3K_20090 [Tsukamurella sp. DT100]|uniref:hypothetical protein n=1 Tax=Tsukamurella sp. DT100 TaxID=3393415 RepID=UPI003CF47A33